MFGVGNLGQIGGLQNGGTSVPNGALVDRAGNFIRDRAGNYIVTATAPRTS